MALRLRRSTPRVYNTSLCSDLRPGLWRRKTCATLLTRCVVRRRLWLCRDLKKTFPNADYLPCIVALFLYTYISHCTVCYTEDSVGAYVRKLFKTKVPTSWLSRVLHEIDVHIRSQSGRRRLRTGRRRLQTRRNVCKHGADVSRLAARPFTENRNELPPTSAEFR